MFFWEVLWIDLDGQIHSMHSRRGQHTVDGCHRILLSISGVLDRKIREKGGRMLDVQVVYSTHKYLYDSNELLN